MYTATIWVSFCLNYLHKANMLGIYIPDHQHMKFKPGEKKIQPMLYIGMAPMIPKYAFIPNITKLTRCGTDTGTRYFRAIILGYFNRENVSSDILITIIYHVHAIFRHVNAL